MSGEECIHGLAIGDCELCSPRQPAVPTRSVRASRPAATRPISPRPATKPSNAPSMAVRTDARRYLVLDIAELGATLAAGPLAESEDWRLELGAPTSRSRVVLVSTLAEPDALQLLGVANEPARRQVAETLRAAGRAARVVVNPAWFA